METKGHRTKAELRQKEFCLGEPNHPHRLSKKVLAAWDQIAASLLAKRILARTDGDLLLSWAKARAEGHPTPPDVLAIYKARPPFPAEDTPAPVAPPQDAAAVAKGYALSVLSGEILAGKLVRQACQRFLDDLRDGPARGISFSPEAAQKVCVYLSELGLALMAWQIFVLSNLFGFRNADGRRRYRNAHIEVGKKNGKTSLLAALGLYMADTEGDGEPRAEVYVAATTKSQSADICFREAVRLREASSDLSGRSKKYKCLIEFGDSVFAPLAANSEKLNGRNMHLGILDELADHATPDLFNVFTTSKVSRLQPLTISITTAGNTRIGNVAWESREHSLQVLDGSIPDDSFFTFIATLDEGDDWKNEALWIKANPSLGITVQIENLRELAARALAMPSAKNAFLRYNVNIWPATTASSWISQDDLQKEGNAFLNEESRLLSPLERIKAAAERLKGQRCCMGLDLAIKNDLSALALCFPPEDKESGVYEVLFRCWCPEEGIERRTREHRVPYAQWADAGLLTVTPGEVTDFQFIQRDILALAEEYKVCEVGADAALTQATSFAEPIRETGMCVVSHKQGYWMSAEIQLLERLFIQHRMCFHGNPIAAWCFANVSLTTNHLMRQAFDKERSREKIDCAVALAMAFKSTLAMPEPSPYEKRGILYI